VKVSTFYVNSGYLRGKAEARLISKLAQKVGNSELKSLLLCMTEETLIYLIRVLNDCASY